MLLAQVTASDETASLAHSDLLQLRVELFAHKPVAERVWQLRANLSAYDAWYVALAEAPVSKLWRPPCADSLRDQATPPYLRSRNLSDFSILKFSRCRRAMTSSSTRTVCGWMSWKRITPPRA